MTDRKRIGLGLVLFALATLACSATTSPKTNTKLTKTLMTTVIEPVVDFSTTSLSTKTALLVPTETFLPRPARWTHHLPVDD